MERCLACEAVVSKADGRGRAAFNGALGCVKRKTSQLSSDEMGSLHHDDPLFTTASQARHAPRAVSPMNRLRQLPDRYRGKAVGGRELYGSRPQSLTTSICIARQNRFAWREKTPKTDINLSELAPSPIPKTRMPGPHRKELGTYSLQLLRQLTCL